MVERLTSIPPEVDGLICAFELAPLRRRHQDVLHAETISAPLWLHFNLTDTRSRQWIAQRAKIPEGARQALLDTDARAHFELYDAGFCVVLGDLHHDFDSDPEGFGVVRIYVDEACMLSVRTHPLTTIDVLRRDLLAGVEPGSTLGLFDRLAERLAGTFASVVGKLAEEVDDAEDRILSGRFHAEGSRLGRIRRLVARLRRQINGNRTAITALPSHLPEWCSAEKRRDLRQTADHFAAVAQDLDLVQERARLLQEEIAARVGEATNRNLFVLSTVTTVLLPVTLITGIFGMNVTDLPFSTRPGGFWWVAFLIFAAIGLALRFLHARRVL
jgi:zinc transporter